MSIYRCAACGSPNVVIDTQNDGIKYDYLKGTLGTVALGAGGAVAGITNKKKMVYKCPDCGVTLTYPMGTELYTMIELGLTNEDARAKLPISWDILKQQFKNIGSGAADAAMDRRKKVLENKSTSVASKEEFDAAVDLLYELEGRLGYSGDRHYSRNALQDRNLTLTDFLRWKDTIKTVIENCGKYIPRPFSLEEYRGHLMVEFEGWFYAYLAFEIEAETGEPVLFCKNDVPRIDRYLNSHRFASAFMETYKSSTAFSHYNKTKKGESVLSNLSFFFCSSFERLFKVYWYKIEENYNIKVYLPYFTIKNGKLGYWELYHQKQMPMFSDLSEIMGFYFRSYPERKPEFDQKSKMLKEQVQARAANKARIEAITKKIPELNAQIDSYTQQISQLSKRLFVGKKKKLEIEDLNNRLSACKKEVDTLTSQKVELTNTNERLNPDTIFWQMMNEFDNFIVWHWVEE